MCYEAIRVDDRTARKRHICSGCRNEIRPGDE